ncbi:hypothetical protein DRH29_05330 [candidate division Kazan bacterium]|uniref:Uncharacterized protein n=1 Tax=candidate division Kazan bacterium TaxID=2202143 RepID=A0A420ZB42_UNCK3|nr:MAG: hypothetical protein DRH29_05330 [candidate division Kazan bacterium]
MDIGLDLQTMVILGERQQGGPGIEVLFDKIIGSFQSGDLYFQFPQHTGEGLVVRRDQTPEVVTGQIEQKMSAIAADGDPETAVAHQGGVHGRRRCKTV